MAHTALTEEEKKEFFDTPEVLDEKVTQLANLIFNSQHMVAFTGAGVSTACGIADYRSGLNTCLKTGAGKWEIQANQADYNKQMHAQKKPINKLTNQKKKTITTKS